MRETREFKAGTGSFRMTICRMARSFPVCKTFEPSSLYHTSHPVSIGRLCDRAAPEGGEGGRAVRGVPGFRPELFLSASVEHHPPHMAGQAGQHRAGGEDHLLEPHAVAGEHQQQMQPVV